jgi:prevent-host-death family protein
VSFGTSVPTIASNVDPLPIRDYYDYLRSEVLVMGADAFNPKDSWTVAQAKARFSEVIEKARHQGPQAITRNGKSAVVIVDAALWERTRKRPRKSNFADFLLTSPLRDSGLDVTRLPGGVRAIDL